MIESIQSPTLKRFLTLSFEDLKNIRNKSFIKREEKVRECAEIYKYLYANHYFLKDLGVVSQAYNPHYYNTIEKWIAKAENVNFPYIAKQCIDSSKAFSVHYALSDKLNKPELSSSYIGAKRELSDKMIALLIDECSNAFFNNHQAVQLSKVNTRELLLTGNCFYQLEEMQGVGGELMLNWKHLKMTEIAIQKEFNEIIYFFRKINFSYNECEKYFGNNKFSLSAITKIKNKNPEKAEEENRNDKGIYVYETICRCPDTGECLIKYDLDDTEINFLEEKPRYRDYPVINCDQINCLNDELYGSPDEWFGQLLLGLKKSQTTYFNYCKLENMVLNPEIFSVVEMLRVDTAMDDGINAQVDANKKNIELRERRNLDLNTIQAFGGRLQDQTSTSREIIDTYQIAREKVVADQEMFAKVILTPVEAVSVVSQQDRRRELSVYEQKSQQALNTDKIMLEVQEVQTAGKLKTFVEYQVKKITQSVKTEVRINYGEEEGSAERYIELISGDPAKELEEMYETIFNVNVNTKFNPERLNRHPFKILLEEQRILDLKSVIIGLEEQKISSQDELERTEIQNTINQAYLVLNNLKEEFLDTLETTKMKMVEMRRKNLVYSYKPEQLMFFFSFAEFSNSIKYQLASPEANAMRSVEISNKNAYIDKSLSYVSTIAQADPEKAKEIIIALDMANSLRDGAEKLGINVMKSEKETQKIMEARKQQEIENQIKLIQAQRSNQ